MRIQITQRWFCPRVRILQIFTKQTHREVDFLLFENWRNKMEHKEDVLVDRNVTMPITCRDVPGCVYGSFKHIVEVCDGCIKKEKCPFRKRNT